jgi:hypothetical protein
MKFWICVFVVITFSTLILAQDHSSHMQAKPATLVTGLGDGHHPVSTKNAEAQKFFDQGLRYIYAFNHDEAARSFTRATELEPRRWVLTTTILRARTVLRRRMTRSRRLSILRQARLPVKKRT